MCNWVRDPDRRQDNVTQVPQPPESVRQSYSRPRLVGAVAAALVALVASAALLLPASTPAVSNDKATAGATVSRADTSDRSGGAVIEQTSSAMDDGVPSSSTDVATVRSSAGHCDHGL